MRRHEQTDPLVFEEFATKHAAASNAPTGNDPPVRHRLRDAAIALAAVATVGGATALATNNNPARRNTRPAASTVAAPPSLSISAAPDATSTSTSARPPDATLAPFRLGTDEALWANSHAWKLYIAEHVDPDSAPGWRISAVDVATLAVEHVERSSTPPRLILTPFGARAVDAPSVPGDGGAVWTVVQNELRLLVADERRWSIARSVPHVMAVAGVTSDHSPVVQLLDGRWYRFDTETAAFTRFSDGHVLAVHEDSYVERSCVSPDDCVTTAHGPAGRSVTVAADATVVSLSPDGRWLLAATESETTITNLLDATVVAFQVGAKPTSARNSDAYGLIAWTPDSAGVFVLVNGTEIAVLDPLTERITLVRVSPGAMIIAVG